MSDRNFRDDLVFKEECYRIVGACFEVYKEEGSGYGEALYQECLEIEFDIQGIPAIPQPELELAYKGRPLKTKFIPDFIAFGKIVVELKALDKLTNKERSQVIKYLKATGHELAILINFGAHPKLEWERIPRSSRLNNPDQREGFSIE